MIYRRDSFLNANLYFLYSNQIIHCPLLNIPAILLLNLPSEFRRLRAHCLLIAQIEIVSARRVLPGDQCLVEVGLGGGRGSWVLR